MLISPWKSVTFWATTTLGYCDSLPEFHFRVDPYFLGGGLDHFSCKSAVWGLVLREVS